LSLGGVVRILEVEGMQLEEGFRECFSRLLAEARNMKEITMERSWVSSLLRMLAPKTEEDESLVPCPSLEVLVIREPELT
jgi:hypothetical protein